MVVVELRIPYTKLNGYTHFAEVNEQLLSFASETPNYWVSFDAGFSQYLNKHEMGKIFGSAFIIALLLR